MHTWTQVTPGALVLAHRQSHPGAAQGLATVSPQAAHQPFHPSLVFDCIEAYAPGFKASVIGRDILTPPDLERIFGLPGGVGTMWAQL